MQLLRAELSDFRNIEHAQLELSPRFNVLVGPNGQGKTNTLEALYLISALRPLRSVQRRALIREGREQARISVRVEKNTTGLAHDLEMQLGSKARTLLKDAKRCEATSFLGVCVAVAFTPDDLQLPKGGPDARRRFLDRALLNQRPSYLGRALRYSRALKDRNRVLAESGPDEVLDAYDQVLANEGSSMTIDRAAYIREIAPRVGAEFQRIANPAPTLELQYLSKIRELAGLEADEAALNDVFLEQLARRRVNDRRRKITTVGPHLDELELTLEGAAVRERASQGQHRAIVLALKLAEIAHLGERLGEPPILLLDDMSSELDIARSKQLFEAIARREGQVVLSSTEDPRGLRDLLGDPGAMEVWDVARGTLTKRA